MAATPHVAQESPYSADRARAAEGTWRGAAAKICSSAETDHGIHFSLGLLRRGGILGTSLCLSKAALGTGVLTMALHCAEVGLAYTLVGLTLAAALTIVSIRWLAEASVATGRASFEGVCDELLHPCFALFTGLVISINCLSAASGYLIVCGQVFVVLSGYGEGWRRVFVIAVGICICGPLSVAPDVAFMRHLALLSVAGIFLLVVTVVVYAAENDIDESISQQTLWFGRGGATTFTYINSLSNMVFAFTNQFNVPQLTSELMPQPETWRMTMVALVSTGISLLLYAMVSATGVLAFGVESQMDTLVLDLSPDRSNPLVYATLLAVMLSMVTCFQFHVYPVRQTLAYCICKARGRDLKDSGEKDCIVLGWPLMRFLEMLCGLLTVLVAVLLAVVISQIRMLLDFGGAFMSAWMAFVLPPLFLMRLRCHEKRFAWRSLDTVGCACMLAIGTFFVTFGTYAAIAS